MKRRLTLTLAAAIVAIAACGTSTSTSTSTESVDTSSTTSVSTSVPVVTTTQAPPPAAVELLTQVQQYLDQWRESAGAPGASVAVSLADGTTFTVSSGLRDLNTDEPVRSTEYWRVASLTKAMVSAVVLQLAEEQQLDLADPVERYLGVGWAEGFLLDGVDYGEQITIADLLGHSAGFQDYATDPAFYLAISDRIDVPMSPREIVDWAVAQGALFIPGTDYAYSSVGHVVAGMVIEVVTGQPVEQVLRTRLFDRVGAAETYLTPREYPPTRVPAGYVQGLFRVALGLIPALGQYRDQTTVGEFFDITAIPQAVLTSAPFTGGGIEAQLDDITAIFRGLFDGTVLKPQSLTTLTAARFTPNYGLGLTIDQVDDLVLYGHDGTVPGFRSRAIYSPDLDAVVAASANLMPIDPDITVLTDDIMRLIRDRPNP